MVSRVDVLVLDMPSERWRRISSFRHADEGHVIACSHVRFAPEDRNFRSV